jgi:hypothetical protein
VGCWRLAQRNKQNQQSAEEEPMTTARTASR